MPQPYIFYIDGMTCSSCSGSIENVLRSNEEDMKIGSFTVDFTTPDPKKTTIIIEESSEEPSILRAKLRSIIEEMGFTCKEDDYNPYSEPVATNPPIITPSLKDRESRLKKIWVKAQQIVTSHWFLGALGSITGIGLLILCLTVALPLAVMIPLAGISTLLTLVLGARSYYDAWSKLVKSGTLTMDTLFAISTLSVLIVSITSFFVPWLPMMFDAGLLIYGFRHIGLAIEETIKEKISTARFQDRAPKKVTQLSQSEIHIVDLSQVNQNDMLLIKPGEIIPVDGYCQEDGILYNTIITGAILPRLFRTGEKVLAGMRLAEDTEPLKICVLKKAEQSYLARLDSAIEQSLIDKAPLEIKTAQLLTYFIPAIISLAIFSGIIIGFFFPPALAIQCAISILISACPCTLGLIIPLAVKTGIHKGAEHGVQFKSAKTLQDAEQIDTIVFDLNGTLTTGIPVVKNFSLFENTGLSPNQFLGICAALEENSLHPVGKAIHSFAKKKSTSVFNVSKPNDAHHSGIFGQINNQDYTIGSRSLMEAIGIPTSAVEKNLDLAAGDSVIFLARENKLIGYMIVTDPLRNDAVQTIKDLQEMGKTIHLCTGADEKTARRYANALGIEHVYANSVASAIESGDREKPAYINELKKKGHKVAMVGDAANDARAIAASDFGIAVLSQNSDELTQQHAGAIIHNGTLLPIVSTFAISQQTVSNINQNLLLSLAYNLTAVLVAGGLLVTLGFVLNPAVGAALMAIQACFILLNVYRFKQQSLPHLQEKTEEAEEKPASSYELIHAHTPSPQQEHSLNCDEESILNKELFQENILFNLGGLFSTPKAPKGALVDDSAELKMAYK